MIERIEEQIDVLADIITNSLWMLIQTTKPITDKHIEDYEAKWPIAEQYLKVHEETDEAYKGYKRNLTGWKQEHLDMMFSQLTLFHLHNFKKEDIRKEVKDCLIKFHERGWLF